MCSRAWNSRSIGLLILSLLILGWAIAISVYIAIEDESLVSVVAVMVILIFGVVMDGMGVY